MEKKQHSTFIHKLSSLFMLLMLVWLTICLPHVAESRQHVKMQMQMTGEEAPDTDNSNPLGNSTEEKSESGGSLLSEYLHHLFQMDHAFTDIASTKKVHSSDLYLAFHPKLIIPPPEARFFN